MRTFIRIVSGAVALLYAAGSASAITNDAAGLWVGEVTLDKVNETVSGVNAANQVYSPDPAVPTPVKSPAHLRIIFHVDAAGKVQLLRGVAIINKSTNTTPDIALITNPALYQQYGNSSGDRITAVAFDFGDGGAAAALDQVATAAGTAAGTGGNALTAANQAVLSYQTNMPAGATADYTNFIQSATFTSSASTAATAATAAVVGSTDTQANKIKFATASAIKALTDANIISAADALSVNEIVMAGQLAATNSLTGSIYLGADHPTNPFRHKWHPSHRHGYAINRALTIHFDADAGTNAVASAGFGTSQITGDYREEISGLHKPLGANQDIGLIAAGRIKLEHVSTVDTLNQ